MIVAMAACFLPPLASPIRAEDRPAQTLRTTIRDHLDKGDIPGAIEAAQRALRRHPSNADVRNEFIDLHLSLAHHMLREEDFAAAEPVLRAVRAVAPDHPDAVNLLAAIARARAGVDEKMATVRQWLELEWFEPAFQAVRQARALRPEKAESWATWQLVAAIGAGDDNYFTKNFHKAFYFYDAALQLHAKLDREVDATLASRWLQSLAHALAEDVGRIPYPPAYWQMTLAKAAGAAAPRSTRVPLLELLRGLAHESLGEPDKAIMQYRKLARRPEMHGDPADVSRTREAALRAIRQFYDPRLSDRRPGPWQRHGSGNWQVLEIDGFRIHHRNALVARRAADALHFHRERIAAWLALPIEQMAWRVPADVYLHADADAFRATTEQAAGVTAISRIVARGESLQSHAIHAHQADPLLLSSTLAHELSHLMLGAYLDYRPMPGALLEGLALHVEPPCRHRQFARLFAQLDAPPRLASLLEVQDVHPPDTDFYAAAYQLAGVMLERIPARRWLDHDPPPTTAPRMARLAGFDDARTLEAAYQSRPGVEQASLEELKGKRRRP